MSRNNDPSKHHRTMSRNNDPGKHPRTMSRNNDPGKHPRTMSRNNDLSKQSPLFELGKKRHSQDLYKRELVCLFVFSAVKSEVNVVSSALSQQLRNCSSFSLLVVVSQEVLFL